MSSRSLPIDRTDPPLLQRFAGLGIALAIAAGCAIVGGFIGFFVRPYYPVIGQLPLGTVITRGGNLIGPTIVLKDAAEESFQYVLHGATPAAIVGNIVGSLVGYLYSERR